MSGMALHRGNRRWPAGLLLILLVAIFIWIGRRPGPVPPTPEDVAAPPVAAPVLEAVIPPARPEPPPATFPSDETRAGEILVKSLPEPPLRFAFPTDNIALLNAQPERFFMFVDRYTPAGQVQVWQAGGYGFVRNPRETAQGTVFTKFHEGIDIAPTARDDKGEPLDEVRAIADGTVGYVTAAPRTSNYGNYIVVLHRIGTAGVFYSLYAHLKSMAVAVGDPVRLGLKIGMLGYTGDGIDRRRSHLHLEIGLILSERFDVHYGKSTGLANGHGNYHGSNLIGLNAGAFLTANHGDTQLMPDAFLRQQEVYYKVLVPNRGSELELVQRYPWLRSPGPAEAAWELSFTASGVPVGVAPSAQLVGFSSVSWVKPFEGYHSWNTRSLLGGSGNTATLTAEGSRFVTLVAGDF